MKCKEVTAVAFGVVLQDDICLYNRVDFFKKCKEATAVVFETENDKLIASKVTSVFAKKQ